MADNTTLPGTGEVVRDKDRSGVKTQIIGIDLAPGGSETLMNGVMPVSDNGGSLTIDGTVAVSGTVAVTDNSGSLTVDNGGTFAVQADTELTTSDLDTGGGTDTRAVVGLALAASGGAVLAGTANPVPISDNGGSVTVDGTVTATGPLTDTQLRATAVPVSGTVTATTGGLTDTQLRATAVPVSLATLPALVAGSAAIGKLAANSGVDIGDVDVTSLPSLPAGSNEIGGVNQTKVAGTAVSVNSGTKDAGTQRVILASDQTVVPVSDNAGSLTIDAPVGTPVFVTTTPSTTGGWSKITALAQTTTKKVVKASAGTFGGYYYYNPNASVAYIQVFDLASGSVTLGTTAPDLVYAIPALSAANIEIVNGVNMANAITLACTTTATGSTAPGTGLDLTLYFK